MTPLQTLQTKKSRQKRLYKRLRYDYPDVAGLHKRNVMLIDKQIRLLRKDKTS